MLTKLDFSPEEVESVTQTPQAETLGDKYMPVAKASYIFEAQGLQASQEYLNKFYDGLNIDSELSSRENLVMRNSGTNDALVSVTGTTGVGDASSTWPSIFGAEQAVLAAFVSPLLAATATAAQPLASAISGRQTFHQRVETTQQTLDKLRAKYGETSTLLLGHSLGGAVVREVARRNNLSSIVYNSAVGRSEVYEDNQKKNIEMRINKDIVSLSRPKPREFSFERGYTALQTLKAHDIENFAKDRARYEKIVSGELKLQKRGTNEQKLTKVSVYEDFYCRPDDKRCRRRQ